MTLKKHVHLIGICGTAMASLAGMLQKRGMRVTGSDAAAYPPMSDFLAGLGIEVSQPFSESNLKARPDMVVVGNAISRGNAELEYVLDGKIPFCSLAQMLHDEFLAGKEVIVVAGTHGKTTTTSMLAWILQVAGLKPSFLVGGIAENFGSSFQLEQGEHFVIEGDEYDTAFFDKGPKFLHYFPDRLILTSVEFDHADIYRDLESVELAFQRLVNLVPRRGKIVAYDSGASVDRCLQKALCKVERYGKREGSDWRMGEPAFQPSETRWNVSRSGAPFADFSYSIAGEYNVWNATAAAAMAAGCGVPAETIQKALSTFRSVKRRLEVRAVVNGITVIDDFAHHPTAIAATLQALRSRYPGSRLWAVLEPRSNTLRRNVFQDELARSLQIADEVVISRVFKSEAIKEEERLDVESLVRQVSESGHRARLAQDADAIVTLLSPELKSGDVVAILSNGGFGGIYEKLPASLRARNNQATPAER